MLACGFFGALGDTDRDRAWVDLGHRLGWGFCWGRSVGPSFFALGPWCLFFLSPFLLFFFLLLGAQGF